MAKVDWRRLWLALLWLSTLLSLGAGAAQDALISVALWSLPVVIIVTALSVALPGTGATQLLPVVGLAWQLALVGAWWPSGWTITDASLKLGGAASIPSHMLVIGVALVLLCVAFIAFFVVPAIGLRAKLRSAVMQLTRSAAGAKAHIEAVFQGDKALMNVWSLYVAGLHVEGGVNSSARELFDLGVLAQSRLRLEFFRNLPGIFTGLGIVGTFAGLIAGMHNFRVTSDPAVAQRSLEVLLGGVMGAFMVSGVAIALAITVTFVEKLIMSSLADQLEALVVGLDQLFPPQLGKVESQQPLAASSTWQIGLIAAIHALEKRLDSPLIASPVAVSASSTAGETQLQASGVSPQLVDIGTSVSAAAAALSEVVTRLPGQIATGINATSELQQQSARQAQQILARLEGAASAIEGVGRRTLEIVSARLLQSEMDMQQRHQTLAEQVGSLVQRMEIMCGLLQADRVDYGYGTADDRVARQPSPYATERSYEGYSPEGAKYAQQGAPVFTDNWVPTPPSRLVD